MPWKDTTIMEQKIEFICEWRTEKHTIIELCNHFEISRPTAYKIIDRFEKESYEGLRELSRKPRSSHPNETDEKVINQETTVYNSTHNVCRFYSKYENCDNQFSIFESYLAAA